MSRHAIGDLAGRLAAVERRQRAMKVAHGELKGHVLDLVQKVDEALVKLRAIDDRTVSILKKVDPDAARRLDDVEKELAEVVDRVEDIAGELGNSLGLAL